MAVVGFRVEVEVVSGGTGVAGAELISMLFRMEGRSELELLEAVSDVLALALVGSRDSSVESTGWSNPLVTDTGSESELGEDVS